MTPDTATLTLNTTVAGVGEPLHTFGFEVKTFLINETDNSTILVESIAMDFPEYSSGENVQFVVDGLMTGETYRFAARAYNQFGVSEFSALSNPITPELTGEWMHGVYIDNTRSPLPGVSNSIDCYSLLM